MHVLAAALGKNAIFPFPELAPSSQDLSQLRPFLAPSTK